MAAYRSSPQQRPQEDASHCSGVPAGNLADGPQAGQHWHLLQGNERRKVDLRLRSKDYRKIRLSH